MARLKSVVGHPVAVGLNDPKIPSGFISAFFADHDTLATVQVDQLESHSQFGETGAAEVLNNRAAFDRRDPLKPISCGFRCVKGDKFNLVPPVGFRFDNSVDEIMPVPFGVNFAVEDLTSRELVSEPSRSGNHLALAGNQPLTVPQGADSIELLGHRTAVESDGHPAIPFNPVLKFIVSHAGNLKESRRIATIFCEL